MRKIKAAIVALAMVVGIASFAPYASASWSVSVTPTYGNKLSTSASANTDTPPGTVGWIAAKQTCANANGQFTQTGPMRVASYHNGWTGVSVTPTCTGYGAVVVARWYISGWVYM